jgi:outer membrane protein
MMVNIHAGSAQEAWTLEECIEYAIENNIAIQRVELNTEEGENNLSSSKYQLLPNLNAQVNHNLNSGRALNQETYEWENRDFQEGNLGVVSNLLLFDGLQQYNTIKQRRYELFKNLAEYEKVKNNISLQIAGYYLQVLLNQELLEVNKNQLEVTKLQIEKTGKLVEVGNVARGELLKIKAQAASEKLNITTAKNELELAYIDLKQLLDLDTVENFTIYKPDDMDPSFNVALSPVDSIYGIAVEQMPVIKEAAYYLKSREKALDVARGRLSPELSLQGLIYSRYNEVALNPVTGSVNYPYSEQLKDNQYKQLSLRVNIPIFNRMQNHYFIQNSKINVYDAKLNLEENKNYLFKDIQQAHADATAAIDKYYAAREAVESNQEAFNYTRRKYEVGMVSAVDYNIAKNDLIKAQSDLLQAKYEFIFKTKILEFYMGNPISLQ